jgi:hypothetical protein
MISLFYLLCGHYLADFGLQNEFTAKFKVPGSAPFWFHVMISHCALQAIPVLWVTGIWYLGLAEFGSHFAIDYLKCSGKLSFNQDQALHVFCKLIWFAVFRSV